MVKLQQGYVYETPTECKLNEAWPNCAKSRPRTLAPPATGPMGRTGSISLQ